ncbi:ribosome recycling factor [bacterium]|nr:ribosome recycling factor [bacterium]
MIKDILKKTEEKMKHCLDNLNHEFSVIRTGRATPALLDNVRVAYYETPTPISHLATVTADPGLIIIKPWDKATMSEIKNAILKADLGLVPSMEAEAIKIPVPSLSSERRQELIKIVHKITEEARVSIRNRRREAKENIEKTEKEEHISEDDAKRGLKELEHLTSNYIEKTNKSLEEKEKEIGTV